MEKQSKEEKLFSGVVLLNSQIMGLVFGVILGLVIFIMTNWIVIKGGHITDSGEYVIGPHLKLLGQYFIGYKVSFLGSIIGMLYGFAVGTMCGAAIGWIYNKIVQIRN